MDRYRVLRRVALAPPHLARHYDQTHHSNAWRYAELLIVQHLPDRACYLLKLDGQHNELADSWHSTVEEALEAAEEGFGVRPDEWDLVEPESGGSTD